MEKEITETRSEKQWERRVAEEQENKTRKIQENIYNWMKLVAGKAVLGPTGSLELRPEEAATSGQWRGSKRVGRG